MNKVPDMISTKDLSYIKDAFEWNFLTAKKCYNAFLCVENEEIKEELKKSYKMHKNICEDLIKLLEGNSK